MIRETLQLRQIPDAFADTARRFYAEGRSPVAPRRAATVMMLRDLMRGDDGIARIEVYMIRRAASMAFAGGLYAFPGGRMDPSDIDVQSAGIREVAEETGVRLPELYAWSRWITPEFEPRRYDTWFYVAMQPEGHEPQDISGETSWAGWMEPLAALQNHSAAMLPPTAVTLAELAEFPTVDSVLTAAEGRDLTPVTPRVILNQDSVHMALPGDPDYQR